MYENHYTLETLSNFNFDGKITLDHFRVWAEFRVIVEDGNIVDILDIGRVTLNDRQGEAAVETIADSIDLHKILKFILFNTKGILTEITQEAYKQNQI